MHNPVCSDIIEPNNLFCESAKYILILKMPFYSKDWRSPGEHWVKTMDGWEKMKILECIKPSSKRTLSESSDKDDQIAMGSESPSLWDESEDKENTEQVQPPHCRITIKNTREIVGFNGLSDAMKRLDFRSAVHDTRRFHYTCALLELLAAQPLPALSGCAQRVLLAAVEEVALRVATNQQDLRTLERLVGHLCVAVDCACWGHPLGSSVLWGSHLQTIDRIRDIARHIQIHEPGEEVKPKLETMPEECVREVVLRLADHKDLDRAAQAWHVVARLVDEQRIWRELCRYHFPRDMLPDKPDDWQEVYHRLRKSLGLREEYAEMLQLCKLCRCLFWQSSGHPCLPASDQSQACIAAADQSQTCIPISPTAFLQFFSL